MPYRLPPLSSLRLFEAAGRHGSFKRAAEELGVTPSAVSHGIKSLEDWLGAALFDRGPQGLTLSPAGACYLVEVRAALERLARATEAVPGRRPTGRLSVSVAPSFGSRWLAPRLSHFGTLHPDVEVTLDSSQRQVAFPRDGVDLAIRMSQAPPPGLHARRLVVEALVPVAAPARAGGLRAASDLAKQTLLHVTSVAEDWAAWAALAGHRDLAVGAGPRFDNIDMALEAAAQGLGIAIGRLPLVADDLAAGRLVAVLGPPRACRTGYWLVGAEETRERPEARAFETWIAGEIAPGSAAG